MTMFVVCVAMCLLKLAALLCFCLQEFEEEEDSDFEGGSGGDDDVGAAACLPWQYQQLMVTSS